MKKYIEDEGNNEAQQLSSQFGRKSRHSSGSSDGESASSSSGSSSTSAQSSFNIKNLDEDEERDLRRYEIQCELNSQGASDLVVDLFMNDMSNKVFKETVLLAIALLEGGNTQVQVDMNAKDYIDNVNVLMFCCCSIRKRFSIGS